MARRADHSREELVELVVEAARNMIAAQGVDKLSARALSGAIGYTPGTLYNHSRDLDDIVTIVNGGTLKALGAAFAGAKRSDYPRQMLHNYADAFLGFLRDNANLWNALFEFRRAEGVAVPQWYVDTIFRPAAHPGRLLHADPAHGQSATGGPCRAARFRQHSQRLLATEFGPAGAGDGPRYRRRLARPHRHPHQGLCAAVMWDRKLFRPTALPSDLYPRVIGRLCRAESGPRIKSERSAVDVGKPVVPITGKLF